MSQNRDKVVRQNKLRKQILLGVIGILIPLSLKAQSAPTASSPATSPDVQEQIRLLRDEVTELRAEVTSLRDELHRRDGQMNGQQVLASQPGPLSGGDNKQQTGSPVTGSSANTESAAASGDAQGARDTSDQSAALAVVQSQLAQLAQTKVESDSKWPVKIYGTILSSTFFNTHDVDWADVPFKVDENSGVYSAGSFSSSLRQSRIGLEVNGPTLGSFRTSGVFAIDFMGGMTDFQSTPLFGLANIVYAYARIENDHTAFEGGQDEMILAPQNPTSLVAFSYPELWEAGNMYFRAPQLRVEQKLVDSKRGQMKLTLGLLAPMGTYPLLDFPGSSNTTWLRPAIQGRLSWRSAPPGSFETSAWEVGVSGSYGRDNLPLVDTSGNVVSSFVAASWAGAFDFNAHYGRVGLDGEGYMGRNLERFGAGIGQPGRAMGGYFEARFDATTRLHFNAGLGDDHLLRIDRIPVDLNRNTALFGNTIFRFTPEFAASLEYRYMATRPFGGATRLNNNVALGVAYSF